jgi:hypothetical protein
MKYTKTNKHAQRMYEALMNDQNVTFSNEWGAETVAKLFTKLKMLTELNSEEHPSHQINKAAADMFKLMQDLIFAKASMLGMKINGRFNVDRLCRPTLARQKNLLALKVSFLFFDQEHYLRRTQ